MPSNQDQIRVGDTIAYLLHRAQKLSHRAAEAAFVGEELSYPQWVSLMLLRDGLADTAGALARYLGHDSGATTRMLDRMEERGLLVRQRSGVDRRIVRIALTDQGAAAAERLLPRMTGIWDDLLADFDRADVATLRRLLHGLVARLDTPAVRDDL